MRGAFPEADVQDPCLHASLEDAAVIPLSVLSWGLHLGTASLIRSPLPRACVAAGWVVPATFSRWPYRYLCDPAAVQPCPRHHLL